MQPAGPPVNCVIGDAVSATWDAAAGGDGRQYRAEITALNIDHTIALKWLDGFDSVPQVAEAQVFKNGVACSGSGLPGGMMGGGLPMPPTMGGGMPMPGVMSPMGPVPAMPIAPMPAVSMWGKHPPAMPMGPV